MGYAFCAGCGCFFPLLVRAMNRPLNLNDFSLKALGLIGILAVILPAALWALDFLLQLLFGIHWPWLALLRWGSFASGAMLLIIFLFLVILEQIQDHWLFRRYCADLQHSRARRIPSSNGLAECPFCGNRQLHEYESACPVCGKDLRS
jgi:hypothetical protein